MARGDLSGIIRFSSFNVDEIRRELGVLLSHEADIMGRQDNLEAEFAAERDAAAQIEGGAITFTGYFNAYKQRQANLAEALFRVRSEIDEVQDRLAEAYKELKTYELTQENRDAREEAEQNRKEQIALDEMGQNLHARHPAKIAEKKDGR